MQHRQLNRILARAKHALNGDTVSLYEWALVFRRWLREGVGLDFTERPYLRELYRLPFKERVLYKSSQMGASEYAVSYALHACDQRGATGLYLFPKEAHISDFSAARIGPALEVSGYLASIVGGNGDAIDGRQSRVSSTNRVQLKRIRDDFLYLRGARVTPEGNAPQLKSVAADFLVLDEVDEMDTRAPEIARRRLGASAMGEVLQLSTPTYAERGIHAAWGRSDRREWAVPCPACGRRQFLTIDHVVIEWDDLKRPVAWHGQDAGRAYAACERCGRELDRLADGEWVAQRPAARVQGFHLTKLFSPTADLLEIVEALQVVDEDARKETYNQDLGLPYKPRGGGLTREDLDACVREYAMGRNGRDRYTFMGVDVGSLLHVVIRAPLNGRGERPLRYAGAVAGFNDLTRLVRQFHVRRCVVDALPETRAARDWQASQRRNRVFLCYYQETIKDEAPLRHRLDDGVINADRTRTLDAMVGAFLAQENILPADIHQARDYYPQMTALIREVPKPAPGREARARYVHATPDHFAHAENYCYLAALPLLGDGTPGVVVGRRTKGWM